MISTTPDQYTKIAENAPQKVRTSPYTIKQWEPREGENVKIQMYRDIFSIYFGNMEYNKTIEYSTMQHEIYIIEQRNMHPLGCQGQKVN